MNSFSYKAKLVLLKALFGVTWTSFNPSRRKTARAFVIQVLLKRIFYFNQFSSPEKIVCVYLSSSGFIYDRLSYFLIQCDLTSPPFTLLRASLLILFHFSFFVFLGLLVKKNFLLSLIFLSPFLRLRWDKMREGVLGGSGNRWVVGKFMKR